MKKVVFVGVFGTMLAITVPAVADHQSVPSGGTTTDSSLDIDLKLGPKGFRFGSRIVGREGYAGGAWLNAETRRDGFSVDGRVERDGKAHNFKFNADLDEWLRRAIHWGVTDL
jgi:hypothetical protein